MSSQLKRIMRKQKNSTERQKRIRVRKHLNADALLSTMHKGFSKFTEHRPGKVQHSLADTLMAGFAMFSLKDPSLLAFDNRRNEEPHNLKTIYGMQSIPCDTSMREILDGVSSDKFRPLFKDAFRPLQRGKVLEKFMFMDTGYLLNIDGTGYFSSNKLYSDACLERKSKKTGEISYHLQAVGAAIVHPDHKEVIARCPEIIRKQDGETKNDCERNAVGRMLGKLRQDHPHLKFIANEDSLASNAPHIRDLEANGFSYILGAKKGDHKFMFEHVATEVESGNAVELSMDDDSRPEITHDFKILHDVPLNQSNQDIKVTFVEYWEDNAKTEREQHFCWVTDLEVTPENVLEFMRGARARWKIENETFNTLKNQGYQFGHNFGLGKKHLSENFVMLVMLAFLIDQIQQLCCPLFQAAMKEYHARYAFWEDMRGRFRIFVIESMEDLYRSMIKFEQVPIPV